MDPKVSINFDNALLACEQKGTGWHLMTNAEWAAIALWCKKEGYMPRGNNNFGSDTGVTSEKGIGCYYDSDSSKTGRVLTGSGPISWSHDGTPDGIYDLNGNVWEWVHGLKIVDGVAHVMIDNNYNDPESVWVNTGVDIVSGMSNGQRILTMREGAIPNTPSMDWSALAIPATTGGTGSTVYGNDGYWFNNEGERFTRRGGGWFHGVGAGVFALNLGLERSNVATSCGFRSAFVI